MSRSLWISCGVLLFTGIIGVVISNTSVSEALVSTKVMPFVKNVGQFDEQILYMVPQQQGDLSVTATSLQYQLSDGSLEGLFEEYFLDQAGQRISLSPTPKKQTEAVFHYYYGDDAQQWREFVPSYQRLHLGEVYTGVQVELHMEDALMEKLFTVSPGASVEQIVMGVSDEYATDLRITSDGRLEVEHHPAGLSLSAPIAWQISAQGEEEPVEVQYRLLPEQGYGFHVGTYDHSRPLYIDPVMISKYFGGTSSNSDRAEGMVVDSGGNIYVAGYSASALHTTSNSNAGQDDFLVLKMDEELNLLGGVFVGTVGVDQANDVAIDGSNNVYVVGSTNNAAFPGISDTTYGGGTDAVVTKLTSALTLTKSAYLGGTSGEAGRAVDADASGQVYIGGDTTSSTLPVTTGQTYGGSTDGFIARYSASLVRDRLIYVGGSSYDGVYDVAVDASGNVYFGGGTQSSSATFPVVNAAQPTRNGFEDAFLGKVNTGFTMQDLSFIGGSSGFTERIVTLELDGTDTNLYYGGLTPSTNWPGAPVLSGALIGYVDTATMTPQDADIPTQFSTIHDIYIDGSDVYAVGETSNSGFVSTDGSTFSGSTDVLILHYNSTLTSLLHSAFLGGSGADLGYGIYVTADDTYFVTGRTRSSDYPVTDGSVLTGYEALMVSRYEFIDTSVTADATIFPDSANYANALHTYDFTVAYPFDDQFSVLLTIDDAFGNFENLSPSDVQASGTNITGETVTIDDVARTIEVVIDATGPFTDFTITIGDGAPGGLEDLSNPSVARSYDVFADGFNQYTAPLWSTYLTPMISSGITINVGIVEALVMTIDNVGINFSVDPLVNNGKDDTQYTQLTVRSNAQNGYTVYVSLTDENNEPQLSDGNGNSIVTGLGENNIGYEAHNAAYNALEAVDADAVFTNPSSIVYSNSARIGGSSVTSGGGDSHTIYYDLDVDFLPPAGIYTGTITYTVIGDF